MSESNLYGLSQDLRLLARASVWTCPTTGRVLQGAINARIEALRKIVLDALWARQDGRSFTQQHYDAVGLAKALCGDNRQVLRQLRQAVA